jgi:hypothetical protein
MLPLSNSCQLADGFDERTSQCVRMGRYGRLRADTGRDRAREEFSSSQGASNNTNSSAKADDPVTIGFSIEV